MSENALVLSLALSVSTVHLIKKKTVDEKPLLW